MVAALVTFTLASLVIVLLPGPDTLVVVRNLVRDGRRAAVRTVLGVLTGLSVWAACAALGVSALLRASHDGYLALRIVGGCYLVWLGVHSLRSPSDPTSAPHRALVGRGYVAGLATNLLNPKVGIFFVTFLPGFVPAGQPVGLTSALFGAVFVALGALYFAVLLAFAGRVTGWMNHPVVRRRLERTTGAVLIGLGARLATES